MSYYSTGGGAAGFGGFGYHSLAGEYPVQRANSDMRDLQQELQRLGYLQSGAGVYGADGKFGPRTATALRGVARYVGWSDAAYSPANAGELSSGTVTIPDDLIERIRAARPDPNGPHARGGAPVPADAPVEPVPDSPPLPSPEPETERSGTGWVPAAVIGGGVIAAGVMIAYSMRDGKKRRPRRNRRRRTSRR